MIAGIINKEKGTMEIRHRCKIGVAVIMQRFEIKHKEVGICEESEEVRVIH